jgi:hypothetical protein
MWRVRQEGLPVLERHGAPASITVGPSLVERLLSGDALDLEDLPDGVERGSVLLHVDHATGSTTVPVWVQAKVTLMLDDVERRMLALRLFGRSLTEEEE